MVETNTKKFAYTTGSEFTLTGTDYVGYFNILNNTPYANFTQTTPLCEKSTYKTDVYVGNFLFDRDLGEILVLPNNITSILFQPNEYVTADNINAKLTLLNDNNIFLYSRGFILDGNSPASVTATIAVTGDTDSLTYFSNFTNLSTFDFNSAFKTNPYNLDNVVDLEAVINASEENFIVFIPTNTTLIAVSGNISTGTCGVALSTTYVSDKVNDILQYGSISNITVTGNTLFVADYSNNTIYKYSIEGYIVNDPGLTSQRFLLESIGTNESKFGIKRPKFITSSDTSIIVYNEQSKFFVEYDLAFNVKNASKLISSRDKLLGMGYSKFYNLFCIITQRGTSKSINFYRNFELIESEELTLQLSEGEQILKVAFSSNDSNVFYIVTTGFIYKKYLSKPDSTIGVFSDELMSINNPSGNFTGLSIVQSVSNVDIIFAGKQDRLIIMNESNESNTILRQTTIDNYDINSIKLTKDEYVQADYLNKELFKVVSNLFKLKNQYLGRFLIEYIQPNKSLNYVQSLQGENLIYKGYTYLSDYNFLQVDDINNLYIHENEKVEVGVINRCLTKIYELQQTMLEQSRQKNDTLVQYLTTDGTLIIS